MSDPIEICDKKMSAFERIDYTDQKEVDVLKTQLFLIRLLSKYHRGPSLPISSSKQQWN